MANEVKIILTAIDNASQKLGMVDTGFKNILKTWGIAAGAATSVALAIKSVVDPTVAYNKQIREMTQVTGLGAEEISRIVQVADDWGIEIGSVRTALAFMNKQGITPSIKNLAELADSYVAAGDKAKWANEVGVKALGRGYQTLIPLLAKGGQALRDQAAAIEDGLIVTDRAIQQSRDYEMAVDALADKWQAFVLTIGQAVIPILNDLLTPAEQQQIDWTKAIIREKDGEVTAYIRVGQQLVDVTGKYDAYQAALEHGGATKFAKDDLIALGENADIAAEKISKIAISLGEVSQQSLAAILFEDLNAEFQKSGDVEAYKEGFVKIATAMTDMTPAEISAALAVFDFSTAVEATTGALDTNIPRAQELLDFYINTPKAVQGLTSDTYLFNDSVNTVGDNVPGVIGGVTGSFDTLTGATDKSTGAVDDLQSAIDNLHDKTITITVKYVTTGTPPPPGPRQHGGPVSSGRAYLVGEVGPELFIPSQSGRIIPHGQTGGATVGGGGGGGAVYATFFIYATPSQSEAGIARQVLYRLKDASRAMGAGAGYAGG